MHDPEDGAVNGDVDSSAASSHWFRPLDMRKPPFDIATVATVHRYHVYGTQRGSKIVQMLDATAHCAQPTRAGSTPPAEPAPSASDGGEKSRVHRRHAWRAGEATSEATDGAALVPLGARTRAHATAQAGKGTVDR